MKKLAALSLHKKIKIKQTMFNQFFCSSAYNINHENCKIMNQNTPIMNVVFGIVYEQHESL